MKKCKIKKVEIICFIHKVKCWSNIYFNWLTVKKFKSPDFKASKSQSIGVFSNTEVFNSNTSFSKIKIKKITMKVFRNTRTTEKRLLVIKAPMLLKIITIVFLHRQLKKMIYYLHKSIINTIILGSFM